MKINPKRHPIALLIALLAFNTGLLALPTEETVPGGIALIEVGKSSLDGTPPTIRFNKKRVLVTEHQGNWVAVVGIPLSAKQGKNTVDAGKTKSFPFLVEDKKYPAQYLTIKNKRMVNPNPDDLKRIKRERTVLSRALSTWSDNPAVSTDFILPAEGRLSSPFGLRRFFNNQPRNPHSGLDIAAPTGTPIKSPQSGTVINTGDYFFNGNTVLVDHGQGLISGYFHMDKIDVQAGQLVNQGDILGTIGSTGRVTGPHLHWNIYLNGTKVNPALFVTDLLKNQTEN